MDFEQMIKLIDAGFTKEDIMKIIAADPAKAVNNNSSTPEPEAAPEAAPALPVQEEEKMPEAPAAPAPNPQAQAFLQSFEASIDRMQAIVDKAARTAGMPSIEGTETRTLSDIVTDFFKEE